VFIHELGHFLFAKWAGIRVEKFSLGFPPKLISKKWGETEYSIGIIPLGGYVKMAGDNPHEVTEGKPWEFMSKKVWQRFFVVFAGPLMNFILAVVVLAGLYTFRGKEADFVQVGNVLEGSPAEMAGIRTGDQILTVDKYDVRSYSQIVAVIFEKIEEPVEVKWRRENQVFYDTLITTRDSIINSDGDTVAYGDLGAGAVVIIGAVDPEKQAYQAGLREGDIIVAANGIPVKSFRHLTSIVYPEAGKELELNWRRGDQDFSARLIPQPEMLIYPDGDTATVGMVGIAARPAYTKLNVFVALGAGFNQSAYYVVKIFEFIGGLISREVAPSEIGGPIFIGKLAGQTARAGIDVLLEFLALLSINLAVLNLLPIPIFDGSHIVFLFWEKIKGAPPSIKTRVIVQQIGLAFILFLVIFVTFNDITR
jgi:regulator of sigma E protease